MCIVIIQNVYSNVKCVFSYSRMCILMRNVYSHIPECVFQCEMCILIFQNVYNTRYVYSRILYTFYSFSFSLRIASSSALSVVIISCSAFDALMTTGTLLLFEDIRASPLSNWVMERISLFVSFNTF